MNIELLKKELRKHEGVKNYVYRDSLGLLTIGVGHLVQPADNLKLGDVVSDYKIDMWFLLDIATATTLAGKLVKNYAILDDCRQRLIVNLCFNMGNKFANFKRCIAAIEKEDFATAALELKTSLWYSQVKTRGEDIVYAMEHGKFK